MKITSPKFQNGEHIPYQYTCDGEGINPPIQIADVPENTMRLALIVEDPDAPVGMWVHWMIWNMPKDTQQIEEGRVPMGVIGLNSSSQNTWDPICPPSGEHRYFFKLFALDTLLDLEPLTANRKDLYDAISGHIIAKSELLGLYAKN